MTTFMLYWAPVPCSLRLNSRKQKTTQHQKRSQQQATAGLMLVVAASCVRVEGRETRVLMHTYIHACVSRIGQHELKERRVARVRAEFRMVGEVLFRHTRVNGTRRAEQTAQSERHTHAWVATHSPEPKAIMPTKHFATCRAAVPHSVGTRSTTRCRRCRAAFSLSPSTLFYAYICKN